MDTENLLEIGERGLHPLFERPWITEAFRQDAESLRSAVDGRVDDIHAALRGVLSQPDAGAGRREMARLDPELRHVLVLLYFDLLDGRLRERSVRH